MCVCGGGGGGGGGRKRETIPITLYTVTTRMTPAFRWAMMRAAHRSDESLFFVCFIICESKIKTTVSSDHSF